MKKVKPIRKNKKHTPKNDVGFGTKKLALDEMGMDNTDFDLLDKMFGGNPVDEFNEILDDMDLHGWCRDERPFLGIDKSHLTRYYIIDNRFSWRLGDNWKTEHHIIGGVFLNK